MSHLLPILITLKPTYLIGTFILFFTIHLHFLILMTCHLHMTLLTPLLSLLQTFMRLSFHWMFDKSPGTDKISPRILRSCAEALCEPLHHLFSLSLRYATLPNSWKIHNIVPVFKAGDHNSANNYRPISLLSNTSKVLERIIYSKIINHISRHISPLQFVFSRDCSTFQQMLIFLDHIINSPLQSDVIYFDISKAFDTVSHSILLNKLWSISITGVLWTWFKCYLTNRYQRVAINNCSSDLLSVISGLATTG